VEAVIEYAPPGARLVFSCGRHISLEGKDAYSPGFQREIKIATLFMRLLPFVGIDDRVEACRRIFVGDTRWTVVRCGTREEGGRQGLPVWSLHVGDPILASDITRRTDFVLFMVETLTNDTLIHEAPAIVGCRADGGGRWSMLPA
jgi:hypothetical protein